MIDKIFKAFNPKKVIVADGNVFTPRIQSTVEPKKKLTYNEIHEHIYKQLTK